jgi:type III secretory pathway component EscV
LQVAPLLRVDHGLRAGVGFVRAALIRLVRFEPCVTRSIAALALMVTSSIRLLAIVFDPTVFVRTHSFGYAAQGRAPAAHSVPSPRKPGVSSQRDIIHNNLAQLLSYKDMRVLLDRLEPEYKRLLDDMCPSQISQSGLLATLKLLLAERVSIRNLSLILEAVAEIAPHVRRPEQIVEQVRIRLAQQICGDLADDGALAVLRLGNRWDLAFYQSLKRDAKGDVIEFDIDPRLMEQFASEASAAIRKRMDERRLFALVTAAETRPYVRMIIERMFPTLAVLSQLEIARGFEVKSLGTIA